MTAYFIWYDTRHYIHKDSQKNNVTYTEDTTEAFSTDRFYKLLEFLETIGLYNAIYRTYDPLHY